MVDLSAGVLTNSSTVTVSSDGDVRLGDLASNGGDIAVSGGGTLDLLTNSTTLTNSGTVTVTSGGEVLLGTIASNTGSLAIGSGGTMAFETAAGTKTTVNFSGTGGMLELGLPSGTISSFGTIAGFAEGDTILLSTTPFSNSGTTHVISSKTLQVVESTTTVDLSFNTTITGDNFQLSPVIVNGTTVVDVTLVCFAAGTLIGTPNGEVPVERLAVGDLVLACNGRARPIVWIGAGRVLATPGRRTAATPVIVRKDAFGPNAPHRDLRVTKGHSFYLDGVLIPVEFLVNHRSIVWDERAQVVELYHVELASHDVLLANGAPAESYRDDGNRWLFQNANSGWDLAPQEPCAPILTGGPIVDAIWRRLLELAGPRPRIVLTDDPDLHLLVGGERVDAVSRHGGTHIFRLPTKRHSVRVASRAGAPAELGLARDPRALGVGVQHIALRQGTRFRVMTAADPALADGFHAFEPDNGMRWTNGDAELPTALFDGFDGPAELVLHVACTTRYPVSREIAA